jgi:homoserine dehydrogenase
MEAHKQLTIGLFGFGVVGEGLYKILQQTPSLKALSKKFASKTHRKKEMLLQHYSLPTGMNY